MTTKRKTTRRVAKKTPARNSKGQFVKARRAAPAKKKAAVRRKPAARKTVTRKVRTVKKGFAVYAKHPGKRDRLLCRCGTRADAMKLAGAYHEQHPTSHVRVIS